MAARVSVIVPARNAAVTLSALLDALAQQRLEDGCEVIVVVDDISTDETVSLAEHHPAVTCVVHRHDLEVGAARNLGIAAANAPILAFTDADCIPQQDWLKAGLSAIEELDIVQGAVIPSPTRSRGPFDRSLAVLSEYGLYETANLFVRRELFDHLGGFDDLVLAGGRPFGEDSHFVWRAKRAGARVAFSSAAVVHHAVLDGTTRSYLSERLRRRHFPQLVALIPELRETFLYKRYFLNGRSAAFDAALAGAVAMWRLRSLLPLMVALPYTQQLLTELRGWPPAERAELALTLLAADAISCAALVYGSLATLKPVL